MGKRTLQDDGTWLTALQRDDVELITDGVAAITADGVTDATVSTRRADVLVCGHRIRRQPPTRADRRSVAPGRRPARGVGDAAYADLGITARTASRTYYCMFGPGTNAVNGASLI